jgi:hypothetical protein
MELAALAVLGGAGFLLAQQTAPKPVYPTKPLGSNPVAKPRLPRKEPFENPTGPNARPVNTVPTSLRGPNPQLDLMYNDLMGKPIPPAEPNPSGHPSYLSNHYT